MGPIWSRQDPGGPHVGPMNFAFCVVKTSPNRNVDEMKRRQTETSTDHNVDKPKLRPFVLSTFCFDEVLVCRRFGLATFRFVDVLVVDVWVCRLVIVTIIKILAVHVHGRQCIFPNLKNKDSCRESLYKVFIWSSVEPLSMISINNRWHLDASWCITSLQKSLFRKFLCEVASAK